MAKIIAYIIAESKGWQIQLDSSAHPSLHVHEKIYHATAVGGIHLTLKSGTFFLSFILVLPSTKFVYERQPMEVEDGRKTMSPTRQSRVVNLWRVIIDKIINI